MRLPNAKINEFVRYTLVKMNENCENCENRQDLNNESGRGDNSSRLLSGVCFDKSRNKYKAYADIFGCRVTLGSAFNSEPLAYTVVQNFYSDIFSQDAPLPYFLSWKFDIDTPTAFAFVADCVQLYPQTASAMKFSNFVTARAKQAFAVKTPNVCVTDPSVAISVLSSAPEPARAIILGVSEETNGSSRHPASFASAKRKKGPVYRYEDVINQFLDIAADLSVNRDR